MNVLLDTCAFLWWLDQTQNLSKKALKIIADPLNTIYLSSATSWEIAIKEKLNKIHFPHGSTFDIKSQLENQHFLPLPITIEHTLKTSELPLLHKDPFDRILIAQSILEDLPLVTNDSRIKKYKVKTIW